MQHSYPHFRLMLITNAPGILTQCQSTPRMFVAPTNIRFQPQDEATVEVGSAIRKNAHDIYVAKNRLTVEKKTRLGEKKKVGRKVDRNE